ncbi:PAS domain S-box protein [uncultured Pseudodesulfovibrio sp.]|uniref:PAS domain S-box protein n=1 Tax=uncultured Pseudodesulfovibrio sp. TaxID=2035858 RepID=UPI0029C82BA8|nr:PAS domain S-box protein [uncultured Pseudodesulfovibrio sp.]
MNRRLEYPAFLRILTAALLCVTLAACLIAADANTAEARRTKRKQILLINSYHQNFRWNEEIFKGLSDVLRPLETGLVLHVENMDTKRVEYNAHYAQQLRDVLAHKFKGVKLELIMVTDNNAFEFMRRYHDDLFPDVPVVFCGVNFYRDELIANYPLFTGVAENVDAKGTLWWALNLHPKTRNVYIITDHTPSGRAITETIKKDLKEFSSDITVQYSKDLDLPGLLAEVEHLPNDSLILFSVFYRDRNGRFYDVAEVVEAISERARVPMYGLIDFDIGHGIVGGLLTSGYNQGQTMAQIALHVLSGRHPKDIPVIQEGISRPIFDYAQLKRFDIDMHKLPEDSEIINRPRSFYSEHMTLIWLGAGFTSIQMVIILVLVANTTRRRQAEKDLRRAHQLLEERVRERTSEVKESEEALRTVFDASHDAIFIHNVSGHILDANERMLKMYGISRDELKDLSIARDISSRNNPVYRLSSFWRAVINGESQYFEWKARRPHDGVELDVEVYLNRISYRGQKAVLANVRDITVRKESENRIRQSLSKFEAILENSLVGIAMSRGRKFVTINRRGAEILGYSPGELIGKDLSMILDSYEQVEDFVKVSRDALSKNGEFNTEQAFQDRQGNEVWCRMYAKTVDPESLLKGVIWAWDDVTDHRRAQEELMRAREDAEAANRAKSEFLAAMSHEIRTPMNAIVGMTDITLQTDLNDDQRDYLKTVMDSAQHLLSIINDILDLSKIEAQKLTLDRVDFDLPFHVNTTIKGLELQAVQKGLEMVLEIADDVPLCIKGDPLSLRQVIVNLVGNAIKFTHRGSVSIRLSPASKELKVSEDPRNVGVLIEVTDTGIGIPEDFIETIFQSFSQTTRAFGGTGLGLAICKELISLMGGEIRVKSRVGKGSTFSFTAWFEPGLSCPVETTPRPAVPEAPSRPIRLLVAEDNDVNVMVTTLRLEEMGYTYTVAKTGLEVLDLLKREPFDLILMDIEMPVLDGISATKAIRSAVQGGPIPDPSIPIVGVTAHALKEFRDKSISAGMNDYVSKPVNFHELAVIINRLVGAAPPAATPAQPESPATADTPPSAQDVGELPVWTPEKAMEALGVDEAIFRDFLSTARREMTSMVEELTQAIGSENMETGKEIARTIKSICSSIGAHVAALAAAELEIACHKEENASPALANLKNEIRQLRKIMDERHSKIQNT